MRYDPPLTLHPTQHALGTRNDDRGDAYRALLRAAPNDEDLAAIRAYQQQPRAYARDDFRAMVKAKTPRFVGV